ncbi:membrane permeability protein SanA [Vibrio breoganii]|nr:membrane permeability protein SanA [Vibrio breoganii]PMM83768.1 membrane permeability protein SanA [Vibrio breoganii]PMO80416.1 membrane permeability protein SanA [Vibrio breoganii]
MSKLSWTDIKDYWHETSVWQLALRALKMLILLGSGIALCVILLLSSVDFWMSYQAQGRIHKEVESAPARDIALILGTSKYIGRTLNPYYTYRIDAAIELYKQQKVRGFLLSGDNAHRSYNEPWTMKRDLLRAGIPEELIFLDYAGFRTLDSIVRAKQIFNLNDFTIVTQTFHCDRALFIANYYKADAICLGVPSPKPRSWFNVRVREVFARIKAMLDVYIMNTQPKFLGPQEPILDMLPKYEYGPIMPRFVPKPVAESE